MSVVIKKQDNNGTALITGGSSGIGYSIANELALRGYNLILASNQETKLQQVCVEISAKYKVKTWPVFIDLALPNAAFKLYKRCKNEQIQVDILVNNAGVFLFGEIVETSYEKAQQILTLHTSTPALLCNLFGQDMKKRHNGHILNISSISAFMPYPGIGFYSATKRFLKSFSRSLRTEMTDYNVNVTCAFPGAVSTELYQLEDAARKKALNSGIMMTSDKLAHLAVNAMFKRKSSIVPGLINRFFLIFTFLIPQGIILLIRRHSKLLPPEKNKS
ncbi:MAG TPA: SDR family NAD(P)-dependent oxidoreductase [Draconibacterium sp.]|nr:SDR family NAD(P)-dependent oxidoreductase [Draconibacterium sp.]